jgi:hypothetical protein
MTKFGGAEVEVRTLSNLFNPIFLPIKKNTNKNDQNILICYESLRIFGVEKINDQNTGGLVK